MLILLVEDDDLLSEGIISGLKQQRYTVNRVSDGQTALQVILNEKFDVIILDIGLSRKSGLEILEIAREKKIDTPILMLTAYDSVEDKIKGLNKGADDYLPKPFDIDELLARVRALQRRSNRRATPEINYKRIRLNPESHKVFLDDERIELPRREFVLLHTLLSNIDKVQTRQALSRTLYGWNDEIDSNTLEVHVHNLRKKFGVDLIKTIRGIGYVVPLEDDADNEKRS